MNFTEGVTIGYGRPETVFTEDLMTDVTTRNAWGHPIVRYYVGSGDLTPLDITDTVSIAVPDRMSAARFGRDRRTLADLAL
ncbi:hypothetical protein AB0B45_05055 [Nonomuraea sp. NPDC049152]|uniref:hypothetical protein n=1 Tax=Nonomuraea sp. NPDC049152 TaxID=3154350 RepID=UPI0033CB06D5